jgi:hypothetical protein
MSTQILGVQQIAGRLNRTAAYVYWLISKENFPAPILMVVL